MGEQRRYSKNSRKNWKLRVEVGGGRYQCGYKLDYEYKSIMESDIKPKWRERIQEITEK